MKIAVQGKLIDTENIYSISDSIMNGTNTETYQPDYFFEIESFDDNIIRVSIDRHANIDYTIKFSSDLERSKYISDTIISNGEKLEKMRQDIVNLWSDNQAKIPTFDIKKY